MQPYEVREGDLLVSTDRDRLDFGVIHGFLSACYWSDGISMEQLRRQVEHSSVVFGLYRDPPVLQAAAPADNAAEQSEAEKHVQIDATLQAAQGAQPRRAAPPVQIGFARILSDFTRLAYVHDVFIVPAEQRRGLGQLLMRAVLAHPELAGVRTWRLSTRDAHGLYARLGFTPLDRPDDYMILRNPHPAWR